MDERLEQEAALRRLNRVKRHAPPPADALGPDVIAFFKQVEKRQARFGKIGDAWRQLVPQLLQEHCAFESYSRGTLTVLVDSSSHLYDLKQLLLSGLEKQFFVACKAQGLRKITLKSGRWYEGAGPDSKLKFDF
jgi:hypothetical protein